MLQDPWSLTRHAATFMELGSTCRGTFGLVGRVCPLPVGSVDLAAGVAEFCPYDARPTTNHRIRLNEGGFPPHFPMRLASGC